VRFICGFFDPEDRTMTAEMQSILQSLDHLTSADKLLIIEEVARSLRDRTAPPDPASQSAALMRLLNRMEALPVESPDDGFSNRDHDRVLYGERS
jgi:hypothetical protein